MKKGCVVCLYSRWSHICCSAAKRRSDDGVHRVPHGVNGVANNDKKSSAGRTVNGEVESHSSKGSLLTWIGKLKLYYILHSWHV